MADRVRTKNLPPTAISDDLVVTRDGNTMRQSFDALSLQLTASGPLADSIANGNILMPTWADLMALTGQSDNEGGEVLGVIPEFLIPLEGLQDGVEPRITATLASRKAIMVEEADGFLALPGGAGTLEEIFDMIMLRQLGRHQKPAAFVDAEFWGPLETLLLRVVDAGFAQDDVIRTISFHPEAGAAIERLQSEWAS